MEYEVVVLGGGIGGMGVVRELVERGFSGRILVVNDRDYYISGPSRPLILSNEQSLDRIVRGYSFLPENVDIKISRVSKVKLEENKVELNEKEEVSYKYLVIATGLRYDYSSIKVEDRVFNVYDLGKLYDLKKLVWNIKEGSILVYAPKQPYRCDSKV